MRALQSSFDANTWDNILVSAAAMIMYGGLVRTYELFHVERFTPISLKALLPASGAEAFRQIRIERPKTTTSYDQTAAPIITHKGTDYREVLNLLELHRPENAKEYLWQRGNGQRATESWFKEEFGNRVGLKASDIGSSSFRCGGATNLARYGFSADFIQTFGRWESNAWKIYVRNHSLLLQLFAERKLIIMRDEEANVRSRCLGQIGFVGRESYSNKLA